MFPTRTLARDADAVAPDGSEVRLLAVGTRGSMAHFSLAPRQISAAVAHNTVEEVWLVLRGKGRMWRRLGDRSEVVELSPGVSIAIPTNAHFQFRNDSDERLEAVGVTMPPWPGAGEAYPVEGPWQPAP
jgi:mannose-6-phosphate isomerase-like protein (cupin superfamily)